MIHLGDITKINGAEIPIVDVITGGSPCQDLSVAGYRAGLAGERSGLFMEQIRVVKEMREHDRRANKRTGFMVRPRYMVWENVAGAFSSGKPKGADFQAVLTEIARVADPECPDVPLPEKGWSKSGCIYDELGRFSIAWRLHDAQFWGVPQRRKRIALVADFGGLSAPEILFERKGMSRDIEQSEQEGETTPRDSGESIGASSYTLKVRGGVERDSNGRAAGKGALVQTEMCGTLGVSQDQTLFAFEGNGSRGSHYGDGFKETNIMYTLNTVEQHAVGVNILNPGDSQGNQIADDGGAYPTLRGCGGAGYQQGYVAQNALCIGNGQENEAARPEEVCKPLNCLDDVMKVLTVSQDAYDEYNNTDKAASIKESGGNYGGGSETLVIK